MMTKNPVKQSFINEEEVQRQDSIGNDPIHAREAWLRVAFAIKERGASKV